MATGRIDDKDTVWLNGKAFRVRGGVQRRLANEFAPKTVIGDFTEQSDPILSSITWGDFSGGIGRHTLDNNAPEQVTELWDGHVNIDFPGHLIPQPQDRSSQGGFVDSSLSSTGIAYQMTHTALHQSSAGAPSRLYAATESSGSSVFTVQRISPGGWTYRDPLTSSATDMKGGKVAGVSALAIPQGERLQWFQQNSPSGDMWPLYSDSSENIKFCAFYRDLLWGVSAAGELFFTNKVTDSTISWTQVATAEIKDTNTITGLESVTTNISGTDDKQHLMLVRNDGFDFYDRFTESFERVFDLAPSSVGQPSLTAWNGSLFYAYEMQLWQWNSTPNGVVASDIGFNQRDGIPFNYNGHIASLAHTPRQLFASIYSTDSNSSGVDAIYVRTLNTGWTRYTQSPDATFENRGKMYVGATGVAGKDGLYPGWNDSVGDVARSHIVHSAINLPQKTSRLNNDQLFGSSGLAISPWVVADANQDWTAYKLSVDLSLVQGLDSYANSEYNSSFYLDYGLNFNEDSWTQVINLKSSANGSTQGIGDPGGNVEIALPNKSNPEGLPFRSIRWRARWENTPPSALIVNSYDMHRLSLTFEKRPKLRYAFAFEIDYREEFRGFSPKEQREFLDELYQQQTLAEFTYRDESPGSEQTYYVRPLQPNATEETGNPEAGIVQMVVMQVAN